MNRNARENESSKDKSITLFLNALTGQIPSRPGQLPQLQLLLLFNNKLSGSVAAELYNRLIVCLEHAIAVVRTYARSISN
jgi:hypothetical protein